MFSANLKEARILAGLSQNDLAKRLYVSQQAVAKWEKGTATPSPETLAKISEMLNISVDALVGYKKSSIRALGTPSPGAVRIPVLGRVAAGIPLYAAEDIIDWEEIPEAMAAGAEYVGLIIQGRSMEPRICNGDVVIVRIQDTCENGNIAIVMVNGDEAACKRVKYHENGISLLSTNPEFPPLFYTASEVRDLPVRIFGVVVELRGKLA